MISIMSSDCEFDRKSDAKIEEIEARPRGSGDTNEHRVSALEFDVVASESEGSDEKVRVSSGSYGNDSNHPNDMGYEMESKVFEVERNKGSVSQIYRRDTDHFDGKNDPFQARSDPTASNSPSVEGHVDAYNSLLSEFDDYVANQKMNAGTSRALSYGFEVGDMVWGKVKSHPWWPGHIFNEHLASSSVRRTRRDGHVLVAFFGDSSYGWFDPAELIPFDPHFMEKSQQTNARTFVKAVEEAVDEASRRYALGLSCKCRNPYNFRPSNVQGYFTVDVPDYEHGALYSANQIKKARDAFQPAETLAFVKQVASMPGNCDQMSMDFMKNKATVFAFRKSVFEEFDETYAQAFGVQPARPSQNRADLVDQSVKRPPKAPLTGPLVIAEALGDGKSSKRPMKVKDHSKKDKYLFKRRDETGDSRTPQISQWQAGPLSPSAVMQGSPAIVAGDYVLQKRAPVPQTAGKFEESAGSTVDLPGKESVAMDHTSIYSSSPAIHGAALDARLSPDIHEMKRMTRLDVDLDSSGTDMLGQGAFTVMMDSSSTRAKAEVVVDIKAEDSAKTSRSFEGLQQSEPNFSVKVEGSNELDQVQDSRMGVRSWPIDAKRLVPMKPDGKMKKSKILKWPLGDLTSEKAMIGEPKRKKKKKEPGTGADSDHQQKRLAPGKGEVAGGNLMKKSAQAGLAPRDDLPVNNQKKDVGASTSVLNSVGASPGVSLGNTEGGLPRLLMDLHALALDPFHGVERNCPVIIRQCFLRFRSLVYQKSLVLSPPSETEHFEVRSTKSSGENVRDFPVSKLVKHLARPDDPTKVGRKRLPSDRQEEIAAKRLKKINQMKSLAAEKKSSLRTLDGPRVEGKEHVAVLPARSVKPDSVKKWDSQSKAVEPTMLVMKFPPETSLPSAAELKARFGRFGSLDQSAIRVFWKSSTCRVVFRHKADAMAAYKYANGNNTLFGNVKVRYILREVEAPAPEVPDFDKVRGDDPSNETPRIKDPMMIDRSTAAPGPVPQQPIQLKSCLKKPASEDSGQGTTSNGSKGTARVTFMLGGEESNRGEQTMVGNRNNFNNNNNNNNNASFADGGTSSSSSVAMDFNSKNFQKVTPPFSSSVAQHSQFAKPLYNNLHLTEVVAPSPRNSHNLNTPIIQPPTVPRIDISQQMLSLLTRCNDVVSNVTGLLGYVPYHPL